MTKKIYLMLLSVFLSVTYLSAQVVQTVNVSQGGGLATAIGTNLKTVTDLTLTGKINAADFNTIKQMTALKNLDMSKVNIVDNAIPSNAFQNRALNSLLLPEGLRSIGNSAFYNVVIKDGLTTPSTLESIGQLAFANTSTKIDLSKSKLSLKTISASVFSNYTGSSILDFSDYANLTFGIVYYSSTFDNYSGLVILPSHYTGVPDMCFTGFKGKVELSDKITTIGSRAFFGATMEHLDLPEGLRSIGNSAFYNVVIKDGLTTPSTLESIGQLAFANTSTKIDLSKSKLSLKTISASVFSNYTGSSILDFSDYANLTFGIVYYSSTFDNYSGLVILPSHYTGVPDMCFTGFKGKVELSDKITTIGSRAFFGATMEHLDLPEGLRSIGNSAFYNVVIKDGLTTPSTLESIGQLAFANTSTKIDLSKSKLSLKTISASVFSNYTGSSILDFSDYANLTFGIVYYSSTFDNYSGLVILPSHYTGVPDMCFTGFKGKVELSDKITTIGSRAFFGATMEHLDLPEGLRSIGNSAFYNVVIKDGLTTPSTLESIGQLAFANTSTKIDLSKSKLSLKTISASVFSNYTGSSILDFSDYANLTFGIVYYSSTFDNYSGLVILPSHYTGVPDMCFTGFKGKVELSDKITTIGSRAFFGATMEHLDLPEGLRSIGNSAFYNVVIKDGLTTPSTLESIGQLAFANTSTKIDLSKSKLSLKTISASVFSNYTGSSILDFSDYANLTFGIVYYSSTFDNYSGLVILPSHYTGVPDMCFTGFKGKVELSDKITTIGSRAFFGATMEHLDLPEGLRSIGNSAFYNVVIKDGLTTPSTLESIGQLAFANTSTKIDLSKSKLSLKTISASVFSNYTGSSILDFSDYANLTFGIVYYSSTFDNYSGLVILPSHYTGVPDMCFTGFKGKVELSDKITTIGSRAFFGATMEHLDLPEGLRSIGNSAFQQITIKEIELPSTVTSIGTNAFYNASQLSKIISNNSTPPALGANVFYGVNKETTTLEVPSGSINLYGTAAQWKDFLNVNAVIPKELDVKYSHDGVNFTDYHAVRIGEYYWIDKNFHHEVPTDTNSEYGRQGIENKTPTTQARLDKYMPAAELNPKDYQVDVKEFDYWYGLYYDWTSADFMQRQGKIYVNGEVISGWGLPSYQDFQQLAGMASPEGMVRISGDPMHETLAPKTGDNPLAFYFENKDIPGRNVYWFNLLNNNKLGFNMMPTGFKLHTTTHWENGIIDPISGTKQHWGDAGDFASLFYTAYYWLGEYRRVGMIHECVSFPNNIVYSLIPVRFTRRLSDEELGYKLYVNESAKDIIQLGLSETAPSGYTELEPGYLRGFYVDKILNNPNPEYTVSDLYDRVQAAIVANKNCQLSPGVGITNSRSAVSDEVVVPFKSDATVTLYPNPVQDVLNISGEGVEKVSIYDMSGRQVSTAKNVNTISVSDLSKGTYLVRVLTANGESTHKVIKK